MEGGVLIHALFLCAAAFALPLRTEGAAPAPAPLPYSCPECRCRFGIRPPWSWRGEAPADFSQEITVPAPHGVHTEADCVEVCNKNTTAINNGDGDLREITVQTTCAPNFLNTSLFYYSVSSCEAMGCEYVGPVAFPCTESMGLQLDEFQYANGGPSKCRCPLAQAKPNCKSCYECECSFSRGPTTILNIFPKEATAQLCNSPSVLAKCPPNKFEGTCHYVNYTTCTTNNCPSGSVHVSGECASDWSSCKDPPTCSVPTASSAQPAPHCPTSTESDAGEGAGGYATGSSQRERPEPERRVRPSHYKEGGAGGTKTVTVNSAVDNNVCDETTCDLRGAWNMYKPDGFKGDKLTELTIILAVDPLLKDGLFWNAEAGLPCASKSITIRSATPGKPSWIRRIGNSTEPFLKIIDFMFYTQPVFTLNVQDLRVTGFVNRPEVRWESVTTGGAFSFSTGPGNRFQGTFCPQCQFKSFDVNLERVTVEDCGVRMGSFKIPHTNALASGGAFGLLGHGHAKITMNDCVFRNNFVRGVDGATTYDQAGGAIMVTPNITLTISNTQFSNNTLGGSTHFSRGGHVFAWGGDTTFRGCSFESASGADVGAAVTSLNGVARFDSCTINGNKGSARGGKRLPGEAMHSMVSADHVHFTNCTLSNDDTRLAGVVGMDDQYYSNVTFKAPGTRLFQLRGYAVYNRDPVDPSVVAGTQNTTFVGCAGAAHWLPCPSNTQCQDVHNRDSALVGYKCV